MPIRLVTFYKLTTHWNQKKMLNWKNLKGFLYADVTCQILIRILNKMSKLWNPINMCKKSRFKSRESGSFEQSGCREAISSWGLYLPYEMSLSFSGFLIALFRVWQSSHYSRGRWHDWTPPPNARQYTFRSNASSFDHRRSRKVRLMFSLA